MDKIKQLNQAYSKRFKRINKHLLAKKDSNNVAVLTSDSGLILFVEHLKYLRDFYLVTQGSINAATTLNAAIEEFEAYCDTLKDFHWNNFCEHIKLNMKEWLAINDSI